MKCKLRVNRTISLLLVNFIVLFAHAVKLYAANTLRDLLSTRLQAPGKVYNQSNDLIVNETHSYNAYVPIQSIEYTFVFNDDYGASRSYSRQTEKYSLKFKIKSLKEITSFKDSQKTSERLMLLGKAERENTRQYQCYWNLVHQLFIARQLKLLTDRKSEVEISVNKGSDLLGLSKVKTQDLIGDLILLQKIENSSISINGQAQIYGQIDSAIADKAVKQLLNATKAVGEKLVTYLNENQKATFNIERKQLEAKLDRISKEVSWADDEKLISHIEVNHDPFQKEDSYRIAFNVPWIRFDNENRTREKSLLYLKESSLARESDDSELDLQRRIVELRTLIEQIENSKPKFNRLKIVESQIRGVKDIAVLLSVAQYKFDLERELLQNALSFYSLYLELLKEMGVFAKLPNTDLLDSNWGSL